MITPKTSLLIVLESEESLLERPSTSALGAELVLAAKTLSLPVIYAHFATAQSVHLANPPVSEPAPSRIPLELGIDDWATSKLGRTIAETERDQIVVAGAWLEEAVTFFALNAVARGLDVYCPVDAIATLAPLREHICYSRLAQAGVVQTTTMQVLREWAALTSDPGIRQGLLDLARARAVAS